MRDLLAVALELVEQSRALIDEIGEFQSPPSRRQAERRPGSNEWAASVC
jgi:hypothetical protein